MFSRSVLNMEWENGCVGFLEGDVIILGLFLQAFKLLKAFCHHFSP